jgi:hypothetical protein
MLPTANRSAGLARRLALLLVVLSATGAAGWLWWSCVRLPNIDFLPKLGPAEWIVYSSGPEGALHPRVELSTVFQRVFKLDAAPSRAALRVAGLHWYSLAINGTVIGSPLRPGKNWKQPDLFEVSRQLRPGENQIAVTVFNTNGPPAMWLALNTSALRLTSDEAWQASYAGAAWRAARLASTPKVALTGNQLYGGEDPWAGFKARWPMLLVFAVLSASVCWFIRRLGVTGD